LLVFAGILALSIGSIILWPRPSPELKQLWAVADARFRAAEFSQAQAAYDAVGLELSKNRQAEVAEAPLARAMTGLCGACKPIEAGLTPDPGELTAAMFDDLAAAQKEVAAVVIDPGATAAPEQAGGEAKEPPVGLAFPPAERNALVVKWLTERIAKTVGQLQPPAQASQSDLDRLKTAVSFVEKVPQDTKLFWEAIHKLQDDVDLPAALADFKQASQGAVAGLAPADIAAVGERWLAMVQRFGSRAPEDLWKDHLAQLRESLLRWVKKSETGRLPVQPGELSTLPAPLVPPGRQKPLVFLRAAADLQSTGQLVFARSADLCYAVQSATGTLDWIARVGYDTRGLPTWTRLRDKPVVVLPWTDGTREALSVVSAAADETCWTWRFPPEASMAGPPLVLNDSLYVLLAGGEVWQVDLATGKGQATVKLPEPAAGPLVLREDGRGVLVVGQSGTFYLLGIGSPLRCEDVVCVERGTISAVSQGIWIQQFLVIFENTLDDRCDIVVHYQDPNRGRQFVEVQRLQIGGRVHQPPVVYGAVFALTTDTGNDAAFMLQANNPYRPLIELFDHSQLHCDSPMESYLAGSAKTPFVAAMGPNVMRLEIDPIESAGGNQRRVVWDEPLPDPRRLPVQPLQLSDSGIVVGTQVPGQRGILVASRDAKTGKVQWTTHLGSPICEILGQYVQGDIPTKLVRTDCGGLFEIAVSAGHGRSAVRAIQDFEPNDSVDCTNGGKLLVWAAAEPAELRWGPPSGAPLGKHPLSSKAISPVSACPASPSLSADGATAAAGASRWVSLVDGDRRLQLVELRRTGATATYISLSGDVPDSGWLRPLWLGAKQIVAVHPSGCIFKADVSINNGRPFLEKPLSLNLPGGGIVDRPLLLRGELWMSCRDAICRVVDPQTMRCKEIALPAPPSTAPVAGNQVVYVGLRNGSVAVLCREAGSLLLSCKSEVTTCPITSLAARSAADAVFAVDRQGRVFELDQRANVVRRGHASGPVSASPLVFDDTLLVSTAAGMLEQVQWSQTKDIAKP
jgi:hypothetical protein